MRRLSSRVPIIDGDVRHADGDYVDDAIVFHDDVHGTFGGGSGSVDYGDTTNDKAIVGASAVLWYAVGRGVMPLWANTWAQLVRSIENNERLSIVAALVAALAAVAVVVLENPVICFCPLRCRLWKWNGVAFFIEINLCVQFWLSSRSKIV